MSRMGRLLGIASLALLATGCATNTVTGRSQLMMVSEESAIKSSASAYNQMIGGFSKKGKVESGTPRALRVKEITDRLVAQAVRFRPDSASWNWEVQVIEEPKVVNAFCMAGGKMAIYTGFWEKVNATDDEIAAVMGHEIGHALASHTREKMSVSMSAQVGAMVLAALLSRNDPGAFSRNSDGLQGAAAMAVTLPNSREAENEADQIGIELAARAGYDPRGAVSLWQKMQKQDGRGVPEFLSTHPANDTRVQRLTVMVPVVDPLYQLAKAGKSTADVPVFLGPDAKENVAERQAYAAKAASQPDTLSFVSGPFEKFKRGEAVFDCSTACVFSFTRHKGDWKAMHAAGSWRDLAVSVMQVGYMSDLSYYMLAEAAAGLNLPDAARAYYERALAADRSGDGCEGRFANYCEGFEVKRLAAAALEKK